MLCKWRSLVLKLKKSRKKDGMAEIQELGISA